MRQPPTIQIAQLSDSEPLCLFTAEGPGAVVSAIPGNRGGGWAEAVEELERLQGPLGSLVLRIDPRLSSPPGWIRAILRNIAESLPEGGRIALAADTPLAALRQRGLRNLAPDLAKWLLAPRSAKGQHLGSAIRSASEAGFSGLTVFEIEPSAEFPGSMAPLKPRGGLKPISYVLTGRKGAKEAGTRLGTLISEVKRQVGEAPGVEAGKLSRLYNSRRDKSVAVVQLRGSPAILRIPRSSTMLEDETRSHELLETLTRHANPPAGIPRPVVEAQAAGLTGFVQTHVSGEPLSGVISVANRGSFLEQMDGFLRKLNPDVRERPARPVMDLAGAAVGGPMIPYVLSHIDSPALRSGATRYLEDQLGDLTCPMGIVHGDLGTSNILVHEGRISGIIDWEAARSHGPPVLDAINYVESVHRSLAPPDGGTDHLVQLAKAHWRGEDLDFLRRFFGHCGADFSRLEAFVLLYLVFHVGPQLRFADRRAGPLGRLISNLKTFMS